MTEHSMEKITCDGCGWTIFKKRDGKVIEEDRSTKVEIVEDMSLKSSFHLCPNCLKKWRDQNHKLLGDTDA